MAKVIGFPNELMLRCPCGGKCDFACEEVTGHKLVIHSLPYCQKFEDMEPDVYLSYVRRSMGIVAPWEVN